MSRAELSVNQPAAKIKTWLSPPDRILLVSLGGVECLREGERLKPSFRSVTVALRHCLSFCLSAYEDVCFPLLIWWLSVCLCLSLFLPFFSKMCCLLILTIKITWKKRFSMLNPKVTLAWRCSWASILLSGSWSPLSLLLLPHCFVSVATHPRHLLCGCDCRPTLRDVQGFL